MRTARALAWTLLALSFATLAASFAAPMFLEGSALQATWWALASGGLVAVALLAVNLLLVRRRLDRRVPALEPGDALGIDFDRPWKGGAA